MKVILLFLLSFYILSTQALPQWFWQNQRPHGNANNRIAFVNSNTYYIVGNLGTIIKTTDNGANWEVQDAGTYLNLKDIHFFNSTSGVAVGQNGTIIKTTDEGETWSVINSNTTTHLEAVTFTSPTFGVIVGWGGLILRTNDGGDNWSTIQSPTTQSLYGLSFSSASNGLAVGDGGVVLKTTDGGISWALQNSGTVESLYDVSYVSASVAYASGRLQTILKTTNGGLSWNSIGGFSGGTYWGISFTSSNNGVVAGYQSTILRTTDGGETWELLSTDFNLLSTNFHSVRFYNSTKGVAVGEYGAIFQTNNAGASWQMVTKGSVKWSWPPTRVYNDKLFSVHCFSSDGAAMTGNNSLFITTNKGATWRHRSVNNIPNLSDLHFFNSSSGLVIGTNISGQGTSIFKTNSGGNQWSTVYSSSTIKLLSIHFATPNHGVAVGELGKILRTSDGGQSWHEATSVPPFVNHLYDIFLVDSLIGYAVGRYASIIKTTDGGITWTQQSDFAFFSLNSVAFSGPSNGIAVGDSVVSFIPQGVVAKTTDGGLTWSRQSLGSPLSLSSVTFAGPNIVYAIGYSSTAGVGRGKIFKSTDGGSSWNEELTEPAINRILNRVSAFDADNRIIVGNFGVLLSSDYFNNLSGSQSGLNIPINYTVGGMVAFVFTPPNNMPKSNSVPTVESIEVTIDEVLHTRTADLTFTLEHKGVIDTLIFEVGGDGQNFISTLLSDDAEIPIGDGTAPFTGTFRPTKPLSIFKNSDPYGEWLLRVEDNYPGNDGILNAVSINIIINSTVVSVDDDAVMPDEFILYQNYPNPFNPSTTIRYQLPVSGNVSLKIYDVLGREVITLINEEKTAGTYEVTFNSSGLASGVYFYQLKVGNEYMNTKKFVLLK